MGCLLDDNLSTADDYDVCCSGLGEAGGYRSPNSCVAGSDDYSLALYGRVGTGRGNMIVGDLVERLGERSGVRRLCHHGSSEINVLPGFES